MDSKKINIPFITIVLIILFSKIFTLDYSSHPCYENSSMVPMSMRDETIYFSPMKVPKHIYAFSYYSKSSYLLNQYTPPMQIIREIVNYDNYIKVHNNPRYYFIKAIEDLFEGDLNSSKNYINRFLKFSNDYISKSEDYRLTFFTQGCNTGDIDWIYNYKNSKEYKLGLLLKDYLDNNIEANILIANINEMDQNNDTFDIFDNIIFIIMKINNYPLTDYKDLFNRNKNMQLNNLIYDNGLDYVLSSHMEALSLYKYFIADNYYNLIKNKSDIYIAEMEKIDYDFDKFNHTFLFPLIYHFESKINFFNEYDKNLFELINFLINTLSDDDVDVMSSYISWLELFKDETLFNYNLFKSSINKIKDVLNGKAKSVNNDKSLNINNLISNELNKDNVLLDSVYFTKIYQEFNEKDFFYDISKPEKFWIPEIDSLLKNNFGKEILRKNNFYFNSYSMMPINDNEKIVDASVIFFYIYDFYNDVNLEENIINKLNCNENINEGIDMFFYSVQELKKIMHP
tara:strand:+ start:26081 stop:27619 length:1539 start_codon:yes stop_codon:yes gene_type:complete